MKGIKMEVSNKQQEAKYIEALDIIVQDVICKANSNFGKAFANARKLHKIVNEWHQNNVISDCLANEIKRMCRTIPDFKHCKSDDLRFIMYNIQREIYNALVDAILI